MTKVMIVDDETDLREMINLIMEKEGYQTEMAVNGEDFLNKVEKFEPDLVTLDVMMPGLTTKEILEKLKNIPYKPKIILLTVVRFSDEEKELIFKMGKVVDYVNKPFELDNLVKTVKKHLSEE